LRKDCGTTANPPTAAEQFRQFLINCKRPVVWMPGAWTPTGNACAGAALSPCFLTPIPANGWKLWATACKPTRTLSWKNSRTDLIDLMAQAQLPDGYLNTYFGNLEPENRWRNLRDWHEMYNAGHLIEGCGSLCSRPPAKPKSSMMLARFADHIDTLFGPNEGQQRGYPGHPNWNWRWSSSTVPPVTRAI
jgi:hypothetical protein